MNLLALHDKLIEQIIFFARYYLLPKINYKISKLLISLTEFPVFIMYLFFIRLKVYHIYMDIYGSSISIIFLCMGREIYKYLMENISKNHNVITKRKYKIWSWQLFYKIHQFEKNIDLIFIEIPNKLSKFLRRKNYYIIPKKVYHVLNPYITNNFFPNDKELKREMNRIKKHNYSYQITNSIEKLRCFYLNMYVPYIKKRYKELAFVRNFTFLKKGLNRGHLMLIKNDKEYVSGSLNIIFKKDKSIDSWVLGVKNGGMEYVKKGAISALYYFTIDWARKHNFENVHIGFTRPFINDTLFKYKRKWKTHISSDNPRKSKIGLKICRWNKAVHIFMVENPFVSLDNNSFKKIIFTK